MIRFVVALRKCTSSTDVHSTRWRLDSNTWQYKTESHSIQAIGGSKRDGQSIMALPILFDPRPYCIPEDWNSLLIIHHDEEPRETVARVDLVGAVCHLCRSPAATKAHTSVRCLDRRVERPGNKCYSDAPQQCR